MLVKTYSAAVNGLDVTTVTIEVSTTAGCQYHFTGLGDEAVKEGRDRIVAALMNNDMEFPTADITVNMAPAHIRKEGTGFDLPLALAIIASTGKIDTGSRRFMFVGELGLDGALQPVKGALPIAMQARKEGFEALLLPAANAREAAVVNRLEVLGMESLGQVVRFLQGTEHVAPTVVDTRREFFEQQHEQIPDYADVKGQESVKRALEVAAAGGHNLIMVGPPGSGKSMMAKRLPGILPPLTLHESLETTQIHSVAGKLKQGSALITRRPFRAPHHTISEVALVGGGNYPMPGEISMAHNGVLFCDELPEFSKHTLEVMRQPLEDHVVSISRARYSISFPCNFMFVASMNPCPCGYFGDLTHHCVCSPGQRQRYLNKISGPLLDRIDIQCEISPVPFGALADMKPGEPSDRIRSRVVAARSIQTERYKSEPGIHCNAQMTERLLHRYAAPDAEGLERLRLAMEKFSLSARAYSRILKVARTIADLDAAEQVSARHIAEAIGYRKLDRPDWVDAPRF